MAGKARLLATLSVKGKRDLQIQLRVRLLRLSKIVNSTCKSNNNHNNNNNDNDNNKNNINNSNRNKLYSSVESSSKATQASLIGNKVHIIGINLLQSTSLWVILNPPDRTSRD